jgi:hypothetical protein
VIVQATGPGNAPGLVPKQGPAASKLAHHFGTLPGVAA